MMKEHINLSNDDVVSMNEDIHFTSHTTSKISEIRKKLEKELVYSYEDWVKTGKKCEVLTAKGGGWVKGDLIIEIDVSFKFAPKQKPNLPSEPTSPLDDLREQLNS